MKFFFLTYNKNFSCCKLFLFPHILFKRTSEESLFLILIQVGEDSSKIALLHLPMLMYRISPLLVEEHVSLLDIMRFVDPEVQLVRIPLNGTTLPLGVSIIAPKLVSPAKRLRLHFIPSLKLLIKMLNSIGNSYLALRNATLNWLSVWLCSIIILQVWWSSQFPTHLLSPPTQSTSLQFGCKGTYISLCKSLCEGQERWHSLLSLLPQTGGKSGWLGKVCPWWIHVGYSQSPFCPSRALKWN